MRNQPLPGQNAAHMSFADLMGPGWKPCNISPYQARTPHTCRLLSSWALDGNHEAAGCILTWAGIVT